MKGQNPILIGILIAVVAAIILGQAPFPHIVYLVSPTNDLFCPPRTTGDFNIKYKNQGNAIATLTVTVKSDDIYFLNKYKNLTYEDSKGYSIGIDNEAEYRFSLNTDENIENFKIETTAECKYPWYGIITVPCGDMVRCCNYQRDYGTSYKLVNEEC